MDIQKTPSSRGWIIQNSWHQKVPSGKNRKKFELLSVGLKDDDEDSYLSHTILRLKVDE